jgi:hypothetical protein
MNLECGTLGPGVRIFPGGDFGLVRERSILKVHRALLDRVD